VPITYNAATNVITVTGYALGAECTFTDIYNADKAGTLSLHSRIGIAAIDGVPVAVDRAERPADYVVLGGASNDLYVTIANWNLMTNATIRIVGTDRDGAAQQEDIVVNANGNYSTTLWFKTITTTQVTVFNTPGGGTFDYSLIQGQWGVVWNQGTYQFFIQCFIYVGPGVAWFADVNKQVTFAPEFNMRVYQTGAHFRSGVCSDAAKHITRDGCSFLVDLLTVDEPVWFGWWYGTNEIELYSTYVHNFGGNAGALGLNGYIATVRIFNTMYENLKSAYYATAGGCYNIYTEGCFTAIENITAPIDIVQERISTVCVALSTAFAGTISNITAEGTTFKGMYCWNLTGSPSLVDCVFDRWDIDWAGVCTGTVYRKYTFNLQVIDADGNGISGATVAMTDALGGIIFSVGTDANGDIAEQTITYGYYTQATGDVLQPVGSYTPHLVLISKAGYASRTIRYTIDRSHIEVEKLGGAAPHGMEYRRRRVPGEVSALAEG